MMYPTACVGGVKRRKHRDWSTGYAAPMLFAFSLILIMGVLASTAVSVGHADKFTDIFYTNSFRGAFDWIKKLDWVGMIVQCVISCFSLFGVALLVIRIMTSMLYLSAKGMWEEVHDLKSTGESEKDFLGMLGMAKTWASGKSGTGLDAIIGAVLILLPDVKKYSDFGEKSGQKFEEDISITQYMLKIALPTIMTVFFFAMGFNGTLFQALAVTVDFMGTMADRAVSINYTGFVEDLINSGTGYQFSFSAQGTNLGKFQQGLAKDIYGRVVSEVDNPNANQLYMIGQKVEEKVKEIDGGSLVENSSQINEKVAQGLQGDQADKYIPYIGYNIVVNGSENIGEQSKGYTWNMDDFLSEAMGDGAATTMKRDQWIHIFPRQTTNAGKNYFNMDDADL